MLTRSTGAAMVTVSLGHTRSSSGNDESALIPGAWEMGHGYSDADAEVY